MIAPLSVLSSEPVVLEGLPLAIDRDEALRFQGYQKGVDVPRPPVLAIFEEALALGQRLMAPRVVYRATAVTELDTATADGQLEDILANGRASSADLKQAAADMRSVMAAARANEASLVRVMQQADSLMTRIQQGNGTLGLLATDSTLYREATATVIQFRALLTDIQAQPRKYLKISVF